MDARPWSLGPALPAPDAFLHLRLRVGDAWLGETGEWRSLADEEIAALWSILGYLRWHAPVLRARDPEGSGFRDADSYLSSRPLVAAIDAELTRRGACAAGAALTMLRAMGLAPWELPAQPARRSAR
jgi:hypothetical protein